MQLPFTREQFLAVFAAYNHGLWPAALLLWIASALVSVVLLRGRRRPPDRWISALLTVHWAWSGIAYHMALFSRINNAAWLFGALFLVQAVMCFRAGVVRDRLSFDRRRSGWAPMAWLFIAYSLAYPVINAIDHRSVWSIPTFGLPCPTTIFTIGLLMLASARSWRLSAVPIAWSAIGGSAALLLNVRADYALPIAGIALVVFNLRRAEAPPIAAITVGLHNR